MSQPPSGRAGGGSQTPLDFVEVDPNAPPLKRAIAPSSTATEDASIPKAAPEAANPEQTASIEKLNRQVNVERSQPENSPQPVPSAKAAEQREAGNNLPPDSTRTSRNSATPTPNSNSSTRTPTRPNTRTNPTKPNSPITTPNSSDPSSPNPSLSDPAKPDKPQNSSDSDPATSDQKLPPPDPGDGRDATGVDSSFSGVMSAIRRDPNAQQIENDSDVTFRQQQIPPIPTILQPQIKQALSSRLIFSVAVVINNKDGTVDSAKNTPDSPALSKLPRSEADGIVQALLISSQDPDQGWFEVKMKPTASGTQPAEQSSRVITLQVNLEN